MSKISVMSLWLLTACLMVATPAKSAFIDASVSVTDFDTPSDFSFSFTTPIIAPLTGLVSWSADVSGTLLDAGRDGVTLTPLGGSIFEFLINGVVVGTDSLGVLSAGFSDLYNGFYDCGVGCSSMRLNIHFTGSGNGDVYNPVSARFEVLESTVPEPGVLALLGLGLAALGFMRRRG